MLSVLINVGKYHIDLFKGPLRSLLAVHHLYVWDHHSVENSPATLFNGLSWIRQGETVFEMAKEWASAPYRKVKLQQIASDLVSRDKETAEFVQAATRQWQQPTGEEESLEFRALVAELDHRNYKTIRDGTGAGTIEFNYPPDLIRDANAFQKDVAATSQTLRLPDICRRILSSTGALSAEQASVLATALAAIDRADLRDDMKNQARVAVATALLVKAPEWLTQNPLVEQWAHDIVGSVMSTITDGIENLRFHYHSGREFGLDFVAHVVAADWIGSPSPVTDEALLRLITSGNEHAAQVPIIIAYQNRALLGSRWWRLLHMVLLWSALMMLGPRFDDADTVGPRWRRWQRWLRTRRLAANAANIGSIDPLAIARRVERLQRRRWERRFTREGRGRDFPAERRFSDGLETHFLQFAFSWLFKNSVKPSSARETNEIVTLVRAFWSYEAWCRLGSARDENRNYQPLSNLGDDIVAALSRLTMDASVQAADQLWEPVFALGPRGHYSISTFLTHWFGTITENTD